MNFTGYKCLCCGFIADRDGFGIPYRLEDTAQLEFDYCPECGSIDVVDLCLVKTQKIRIGAKSSHFIFSLNKSNQNTG